MNPLELPKRSVVTPDDNRFCFLCTTPAVVAQFKFEHPLAKKGAIIFLCQECADLYNSPSEFGQEIYKMIFRRVHHSLSRARQGIK